MAGYKVTFTFTFTLKYAESASLVLLQCHLKQIMHFKELDQPLNPVMRALNYLEKHNVFIEFEVIILSA